MDTNSEISRLRIYASSTDKIEHNLLSEFLVKLAHKHEMAGATVHKGILGFGSSSIIHSYKLWEISEKVPIVIEVIDNSEKIKAYFELIKPYLESMSFGCLVTSEKVDVLVYKSGIKKSH
jgi:uncharacterized protein